MQMATKGRALCAAALICFVTACNSTAPAVDTAKETDAIKAAIDQTVAAFNAHDAAGAVAIDTDDYVFMMHGAPNSLTKQADLDGTAELLKDPAAKLDVGNEVVDVAASGDIAVVRATYALTTTDPATKEPATEHGNWVLGFKKEGDSWKTNWSVVSNTPAPAE